MSLELGVVRRSRSKYPPTERRRELLGLGKLGIEFCDCRLSVVAAVLSLALDPNPGAGCIKRLDIDIDAVLRLASPSMLRCQRIPIHRTENSAREIFELVPRPRRLNLLVEEIH